MHVPSRHSGVWCGHHNTFYFSLNWLVLWQRVGKHVNYAKRQQEPRKKIWNDETKSRTKQRTHKFYESLTYLTAIMSCFTSPQGSGYTSAPAPPPTGLFWAEFLILRCWDVWRFEMEIYMKRKGRRPGLWLGLRVPWPGAGHLSSITVISTLNDVLTGGVSSYGKYFSSLGKKPATELPVSLSVKSLKQKQLLV